jgi:hypothetical protein
VNRAVSELSLLNVALLVPLRHLALKVFAVDGTAAEALPPDFVAQWAATLQPLQELAAQFASAFGLLARLEAAKRGPAFIDASSLYDYDLSGGWWNMCAAPQTSQDAASSDAMTHDDTDQLILALQKHRQRQQQQQQQQQQQKMRKKRGMQRQNSRQQRKASKVGVDDQGLAADRQRGGEARRLVRRTRSGRVY